VNAALTGTSGERNRSGTVPQADRWLFGIARRRLGDQRQGRCCAKRDRFQALLLAISHCNNIMTDNGVPLRHRAEPCSGRCPDLEASVPFGQRIRLRPASRLAREWDIPPQAEGTLICRYHLTRAFPAPERLDVRFGPKLVVWGAPAGEFELVGSDKPTH
jgi:hypothetical protein